MWSAGASVRWSTPISLPPTSCTDDFKLITPGGIPLTKDEYLGAIASGSVNYLLEPEAIHARVHLDAGCLRYRSTIHIMFDGQEDGPDRFCTPTTTKGAT